VQAAEFKVFLCTGFFAVPKVQGTTPNHRAVTVRCE